MSTLPEHITEDGLRQNLRRSANGSGLDMAYHYRDFLQSCGWIDQACVITAEGRKALRETEGRR